MSEILSKYEVPKSTLNSKKLLISNNWCYKLYYISQTNIILYITDGSVWGITFRKSNFRLCFC